MEPLLPASRDVELQPYLDVLDKHTRGVCAELQIPLQILSPRLAAADEVMAQLETQVGPQP